MASPAGPSTQPCNGGPTSGKSKLSQVSQVRHARQLRQLRQAKKLDK